MISNIGHGLVLIVTAKLNVNSEGFQPTHIDKILKLNEKGLKSVVL